MTNRLQLSAACISHLLTHWEVAPLTVSVPLGLGLRLDLTLDPHQVRFEGDCVLVPIRPARFSTLTLRLNAVSIERGILWFAVDAASLGSLNLPVGALLNAIARKVLPKGGRLRHERGRYGLEIERLLDPRFPLIPTAIRLDNGVALDVEPRAIFPQS